MRWLAILFITHVAGSTPSDKCDDDTVEDSAHTIEIQVSRLSSDPPLGLSLLSLHDGRLEYSRTGADLTMSIPIEDHRAESLVSDLCDLVEPFSGQTTVFIDSTWLGQVNLVCDGVEVRISIDGAREGDPEILWQVSALVQERVCSLRPRHPLCADVESP